MKSPLQVTVYDPDGLNPYGREIAALLTRAGHFVRLLTPADVEWIPEGVVGLRVLPAVGSRSRVVKALQLLAGVSRLLVDAARGRVILVCWSWYLIEKLAVALAARVGGRLIVVVHNPGGRGRQSRWTAAAERLEHRYARSLVAHSVVLAPRAPAATFRVCIHPPYITYAEAFRSPVEVGEDPGAAVLLSLGAIRADKRIDLLADVFSRVPPGIRARLRLRLIGRDRELGRGVVEAIAPIVPVVNDLDERGVGDVEIVSALAAADALLAFYPGATQSGSAILALTVGTRVLAFDAGALHEVIRSEFLVATDDLDAAAALIGDLVEGRLPPSANTLELRAWEARAKAEWSSLVEDASARK